MCGGSRRSGTTTSHFPSADSFIGRYGDEDFRPSLQFPLLLLLFHFIAGWAFWKKRRPAEGGIEERNRGATAALIEQRRYRRQLGARWFAAPRHQLLRGSLEWMFSVLMTGKSFGFNPILQQGTGLWGPGTRHPSSVPCALLACRERRPGPAASAGAERRRENDVAQGEMRGICCRLPHWMNAHGKKRSRWNVEKTKGSGSPGRAIEKKNQQTSTAPIASSTLSRDRATSSPSVWCISLYSSAAAAGYIIILLRHSPLGWHDHVLLFFSFFLPLILATSRHRLVYYELYFLFFFFFHLLLCVQLPD